MTSLHISISVCKLAVKVNFFRKRLKEMRNCLIRHTELIEIEYIINIIVYNP